MSTAYALLAAVIATSDYASFTGLVATDVDPG